VGVQPQARAPSVPRSRQTGHSPAGMLPASGLGMKGRAAITSKHGTFVGLVAVLLYVTASGQELG